MAKNVTNEAVLVALKGLGVNITGPVSMTGAQNSEWKGKLYEATKQHFLGKGEKYPRDAFDKIFSRAIETAKKIKDIPVDADPVARLALTLRAYGTDEKTMLAIQNEAKRVRKTTPGIYQGGKEYSERDYAQAAANVMGHSGAVLDAFSNAGIKQPPPPAPGTEGARITPQVGTPDFTGVPMAADVPGAQKYVRADLKPQPGGAPTPTTKRPGAGGGAGGGGGGGGGGAAVQGLPANASDADVEAYFRKHYGAEAWMLGISDFKDIIRGVATNPSGWTLESVISAVQQKPWWQQNGKNVADYLKIKANDPVGFQQALGNKTALIKNAMATYGITLSDERIAQIGDMSYKWNWDQTQINKAIADEFDYSEGQHSVFIDKMKQDAKNYLVPIDEKTIDAWGDRLIMGGEAEAGNWQQFLKEQAKSMFPSFGARLDGGETMKQISKPYSDLAAKWLEIDPESVDFTDPKWMKALDTVDDKGQRKEMSYADWTRTMMNDPIYRYDYTTNAKESAAGMATGILQKFGVIGG